MNHDKIKRLIENLSWNKNLEIQRAAIKGLMDIDDEYTPLLIQEKGKDCWENAVKVLKIIGFPRNKLAIPNLIMLMQDMNWPGVPMAIDIMKDIDKSILIPHIETSLMEAAENEDYMWIGGIQRLLEILEITELDFSNKEVYNLLILSDW